MDHFTLIRTFTGMLESDKKYLSDRSTLHHNYEALEGFWRRQFRDKNDPFNEFIKTYGGELWKINGLQSVVTQLCSLECVGSSNFEGFDQTEEIAKATMYLRYYSGLFKKIMPTCDIAGCRDHKKGNGLCSIANGRKWTKKDHDYSSFKALMFIIRQVRNNLFHGSKFNMEAIQYKRDKKLVSLSAKSTEIILDNLSRIINKRFS